jgi:hypothetical protein
MVKNMTFAIQHFINIRVIACCALLPSLSLVGAEALGADHFVSSGTTTVDCGNFNGGIKPGDTITLQGGARGPLTIRNCNGLSGNPIVIRNDTNGAQVVISRGSASSGGFIFHILDSEHFVIDGTGGFRGSSGHCGWLEGRLGRNCGIKITRTVERDSPTGYLKFSGLFRNYTVRGIHIDGMYWGDNPLEGSGAAIGIQQHDISITASSHPTYWRENITYEQNYIHNTRTECMYIGPNHSSTPEIPLRNIRIQNNYCHDAGYNAITLKSAFGGENIIQGNYGRNVGLLPAPSALGGIQVFDSSHAIVRNNKILGTYGWCIGFYNQSVPSDYSRIASGSHFYAENNLGVRCGINGAESQGQGIVVGARSGGYYAVPTVRVDYNTLVDSQATGIAINKEIPAGNTFVRNNIVTTPKAGSATSGPGEHRNNWTGSLLAMSFADASTDNYRLQPTSPAIGTGLSPFPATDLDGLSRPQAGVPDRGAFEFAVGAPAPKSPPAPTVE